jgi:hypothetical protein
METGSSGSGWPLAGGVGKWGSGIVITYMAEDDERSHRLVAPVPPYLCNCIHNMWRIQEL